MKKFRLISMICFLRNFVRKFVCPFLVLVLGLFYSQKKKNRIEKKKDRSIPVNF